ncbi:MAG: hypothetical protein JRF49_00665 [Deltaproteobacteria bacterium]|nr:hypothetical protein [Deltaproteobacteria bacterium]MBW2182364.1 hypothetical protein [Deltaproteobacteria bacterium]
MNEQKKRLFLIKVAYWLGIGADAIWAIGLLFPQVFGILTGRPDFNPDLQTRLIMGMGGSLMTGWTFLLLWAVRKPIERRVVILLTAFPVVFGMFIVSLIGILYGDTSAIWILIKTLILITSMIISYILADKMAKEKE